MNKYTKGYYLAMGSSFNHPKYIYIGRKPCGCAVSLAADYGDERTKQFVTDFKKDGLRVERILIGTKEYKNILANFGCHHNRPIQPTIF